MARLYLLFASIYLLEGMFEVSYLNIYLKKVHEFDPTEIGWILFIGGFWFIFLKPVIGFIADWWKGFSIRWTLAGGLICSIAGWLVIANAQSVAMMTLGISLKVIAIAVMDVLIDGMIVTVSTAKNRSHIQNLIYGCRFGGSMLCALLVGWQYRQGAAVFPMIYQIFSVISLAVLIPVFLYRRKDLDAARGLESDMEKGASPKEGSFSERFRQLVRPGFVWLLLLLFLYAVGADTATYSEGLYEEKISGEFLSMLIICLQAGTIVGILVFSLLKRAIGVKAIFIISLLGWSAVELSCLVIANWNGGGMIYLYGGMIYFMGGFFNAFAGITLLTVVTAMCKIRGIETFAFAFAISVKNFFDHSQVLIGGYVMEWVGLNWLFVISSLCGLLPFLVLRKIDFRDI